ncbi:MAG: hypothetical protein K2L04_07435 [Alistipes sp.]|nr:hypothetical protein [Alistipes sp.]
MKYITYISVILGTLGLAACADDGTNLPFGPDNKEIAIGADGGTRTVRIASDEAWIATTDAPWITVSPANGRGTTECQLIIDSALLENPRRGVIRFQNQQTRDNQEITVTQEGYAYAITLAEPEVSVENFALLDERYFDVKVKTNVDFNVAIPDTTGWLQYDSYKVEIDRGIRPREVTVRFKWNISSIPRTRNAEIAFIPKREVTLSQQDKLYVAQKAAAEIKKDTREGDSVALLGVSRSLNTWNETWDTSESMDNWSGVVLWEENMEGCTPEKIGRVRSASFLFFATKEGIPYEVQYLTAAESLTFFSNTNTHQKSLNTGDAITKLPQLKRLTISGYGLTELHPDFKNLKSLEYLDVSSNNIQKFPEVLTKENLPNLRALVMNANQRSLIYDLSNSVAANIGGLIDESEFPRHLLEWGLDTLRLSVNYLQGSLPSYGTADAPQDGWTEFYTEADIAASANDKGVDTLPRALIGTPKVMPRTKFFAINLNRLSGELPYWLLYHPALDWWLPDVLVFSQEGIDANGRTAGFDNEPVNMNYYYDFYTTKTRPSEETDED